MTIENSEGPRAITYGERVNKSLTHLDVQRWMAKNSDMLKQARLHRALTSAAARRLLDALIVNDQSIKECAQLRFGATGKLDLVNTRSEVRAYLMAFAGLLRLPGAN